MILPQGSAHEAGVPHIESHMSMMIYLNGELLRPEEGRISPFDRGFLFGDGLFETIRLYDGRAHLLGRHLDRLAASATFLAIDLPTRDELVEAVRATTEANTARDAALRLTVTRGVGDMLFDLSTPAPTVLITHRPLLQSGGFPDGERVITLPSHHAAPEIGRRVKSLSYLTAIHSAPQLASAGVREGILLTREGIVAEGTVSNLFCIAEGGLHTPPLSLGVLDGVTRRRVMELAEREGIEVRETSFDLSFMKSAGECFYTNSLREIVPVTAIDDDRIGNGKPGAITMKLLAAYRAEAPAEWI